MAGEQPQPSHHALVGDFSGTSTFAALDPVRDLIVLNVGGIRHETLVSTLTKYPDTRLGQLALVHSDMDVEEYFFDRNPEVFNAVMDYYRSGELHIPADVCGVVVKRELEYWNIKEILIEPCCWASYCENIDRQEALASLCTVSEQELLEERQMETATGLARFRLTVWRLTYRPSTSTYARVYSIVSMLFVFTAIIGCVLETVPKLQVQTNMSDFRNACGANRNQTPPVAGHRRRLLPEPIQALHVLDYVCSAFFTVELLVRLLVTPTPLAFIRSPVTVIDFVAIVPCYLTLIVNAALDRCVREENAAFVQFVYILRVIRVFRVFQMLAYFKPLQILLRALRDSVYELLILFVFTLICMLVFATLIFYAERNKDETKFINIPIGFWWALITITTVGYGDMFPDSIPGYFVGGACALSGTVIMALTIPILSNNFTLYYTHTRTRDQADVKEKVRQSQLLLQDSIKKSLIDNTILIAGARKSVSRELSAKLSKLEGVSDRIDAFRTPEPRLSVSVRSADGRKKSVAVNEDFMFDKAAEGKAVKKIRKSKLSKRSEDFSQFTQPD